jgi:hypothetical protein
VGSTLATEQSITMPAWVAEQVSAWLAHPIGNRSLTLHAHKGTVGVIEVHHGACPMCGQPLKERLTKPN